MPNEEIYSPAVCVTMGRRGVYATEVVVYWYVHTCIYR